MRCPELTSRSTIWRATATTITPRSRPPAFEGKSRVQQHQLVYKALGGRMGGELHALALTTEVPK